MESIAISGKAKVVFRLIELKARYEEQAKARKNNVKHGKGKKG